MIDEKRPKDAYPYEEDVVGGALDTRSSRHITGERDVFGYEEGRSSKYKTLSWQLVAVLMIAEIVSNGMLSLPSSGGVVGVSLCILPETFGFTCDAFLFLANMGLSETIAHS